MRNAPTKWCFRDSSFPTIELEARGLLYILGVRNRTEKLVRERLGNTLKKHKDGPIAERL
jgi:hypothetical protein